MSTARWKLVWDGDDKQHCHYEREDDDMDQAETASTSLRITDHWSEWIGELLPEVGAVDRVTYEMGFTMTEQGPAVAIAFFAPGPLLGTTMTALAVVPNPSVVTRDAMENVVRGSMETLAQERSRQIGLTSEPPPVPPVPPLNGAGGHPLLG